MPDRHQLRRDGPLFQHDRRWYSFPLGDGRYLRLADLGISGGMPFIVFAYFAIGVVLVLVVSKVPIIGLPLTYFWLPVRLTIFPVGIAFALSQLQPDGCGALTWLTGWLRHRCSPRTRYAGRSVRSAGSPVILDQRVGVASDSAGPRLRPASIRGPGRVEFTEDVVVTKQRRSCATARLATELDANGVAIVDLDHGDTLRVLA